MEGHFFDVQRLLKNGQKGDSFSDHFEQHFKSTMPQTDLRRCMSFRLVKKLIPIGEMKSFMKPNFNLCIEEHLTILKKICDKLVTFMNINF